MWYGECQSGSRKNPRGNLSIKSHLINLSMNKFTAKNIIFLKN
jgi:hypothetical protein